MNRLDSSFRDPDGYMFEIRGELYRGVNISYKAEYDHLLSSGLYQKLVDRRFLLPFHEVDPANFDLSFYKVLKPERIKFISYPYEWAFDMLKDAALLTLTIQKLALDHGMTLKDASAYNVQFQKGKPIFIDTLSFEFYCKDRPWNAYRQFCQHFLAPLVLMAKVDLTLSRMLIIYLDGIPLDLAAKILPFSCRFNLGLYLNIFLHAQAQKKHEHSNVEKSGKNKKFSLRSMSALIDGLDGIIQNQNWKGKKSEWAEYSRNGIHNNAYSLFKKGIISDWLETGKFSTVWDIGANVGDYSRLAAQKGLEVVSFDIDPYCVLENYKTIKLKNETNIIPILLDLSNPSPSIGWALSERLSVFQREKPDLIMALAIIHHLVISYNIPLESIAKIFAGIAANLIIEFVPKVDEKIKILLQNREDIFTDYTQTNFEHVFLRYYKIEQFVISKFNNRIFYLMNRYELSI